MANKTSNFSILVDVDFDTKQVQKKLDNVGKQTTLEMKTKGIGEASKKLDGVAESSRQAALSFQAANEVYSTTIDIIGSMVEQVFELDSALTEFRKVTDLSGQALDDYTVKLATMGQEVARTGEPKCLTPNVQMVNVH